VARRRVLAMRYRGRERAEETLRETEPLGILFYGGNWYLVAWCRLRNDLRHFRVDRIQSLELRAETFGTREDFSLSRHVRDYAKQGDTFPAKVWFAAAAQERAAKECYSTLVPETEDENGTEFTLLTWSYDWLARWLLSFAGDAEALEPAVLREKVAALAEEVAATYRKKRRRS
jgi:predicted DNA-binding transcriptional regulator YafY